MGYPVYKLIRAVNRQYPNNGFIDYVDVTEGTDNEVIDEDLRDLINEAIQETYIDIARDEVYSFPTVPGQNQYVLPDDCELRDIQEVTRTFRGPGPFPPPPMPPEPEPIDPVRIIFNANGGTGEMPDMIVSAGDTIVLPFCDFIAPAGKEFHYWEDEDGNHYNPGDEFTAWSIGNVREYTFKAIWNVDPEPVWEYDVTVQNVTPADLPMTLYFTPVLEAEESVTLAGNGGSYTFYVKGGEMLADRYSSVYIIDYYGETRTVPTDVIITQDTLYEYTQPTIGPDPQHDYIVSFTIDNEKGHFSIGINPHIENREDGDYVGPTPYVVAESGYTFEGWSTDGSTVIDEQIVQGTVVHSNIAYIGVFSASPLDPGRDPEEPDPQHDDVELPPFNDNPLGGE